jgi:DNA transformation protein and related proteins
MAKRAARSNVLGEGSIGAFILDQLSALGKVDARPMFGGAGFYHAGDFFGILFKDRLYFRVSDETIGAYRKRGMKPFAPFKNRGTSKRYYEVPADVIESPDELVRWAKQAVATRLPSQK